MRRWVRWCSQHHGLAGGERVHRGHGSWNRKNRSGYKVIRIPFEKGKPEGGYENFLTGWVPDETAPEVWGRPVGVEVIRDGSMLVVDDGGKKVWRVTYKGKK